MRRYLASPWVEANLRHFPKGGRALDLGCGRGRHTLLLLDLGFEVTAVDCNDAVLAELRRKVPSEQLPRLTLLAENVEATSSLTALLEPPFAIVIVVNYVCRPLLQQIAELVAPDGLLVFEAWAEGNEQFAQAKSAEVAEHRVLRANELLQLTLPKFTVLAYAHGPQEDYEGRDCVKQMICARRHPTNGKAYARPDEEPLASLLRPGASKALLLKDPAFGIEFRIARGALPRLGFSVEELLSSLYDFDPVSARSSQLVRMKQRLEHGEQEAAELTFHPPFSVTAVRRTKLDGKLTTETLEVDSDIRQLLQSSALRTSRDVLERGAGWTLVVNHLQSTSPQLQAIHQQVFALTGLSGGMNAYLTPPGAIGKPPHVDDHDVLVLQLSGAKKWLLLDTATRELKQEVILHEGDVLYLPQGIPHHAEAADGESPSLHVALGLHRLPLSTAFVLAAMLTLRASEASRRLQGTVRLPGSIVEEMESRGQAFAAFGSRDHWLHQLLNQHLPLVEALDPEDLAREQSLLSSLASTLRSRAKDLAELIRGTPPCADQQKSLLRAAAAGCDVELLQVAQLPEKEFVDLALKAFWARREHVLDQHFAQHGPLAASTAWSTSSEARRWRRRVGVAAMKRQGGILRVNGFRLAELEGASLEAAALFLKSSSDGLRVDQLPERLRSVGPAVLRRLISCGALEPAE